MYNQIRLVCKECKGEVYGELIGEELRIDLCEECFGSQKALKDELAQRDYEVDELQAAIRRIRGVIDNAPEPEEG